MMNYKEWPEWMTDEAKSILKGKSKNEGYLKEEPHPLAVYERIANKVGAYMGSTAIRDDILYCLYHRLIGVASPVFVNFGTKTGLPISCYTSHVDDTLRDIFFKKCEVAEMESNGGAVGVYLGDVRPAGAKFGLAGKASGITPIAEIFDRIFNYVSQNSTRRGSGVIWLPIEHGDVYGLLQSKDHFGDPRKYLDCNIALTVPDSFMKKVLAGEAKATKLWAKVLETQMKCGSPYLMFVDNVNEQNPECYKKLDLEVSSSNLCFTGDTKIAVADGRNSVSIAELCGTEFLVYSAKLTNKGAWKNEIKKAKAFKSGTKKVIKLTLSDGSTFRCTPDHELALRDGTWIKAKNALNQVLEPFTNSNGFTVVAIKEDLIEDVYDLTVEDNHNFYIITSESDSIKSGVLVHNCAEITGYTSAFYSFVCCLSSVNVALADELKSFNGKSGFSVPALCTILLDAVIEEFIEKGSKIPELANAVRFAEASRMIGVGTMGLAYYYQTQGWAFKSYEARQFNKDIHRWIYSECKSASAFLAQKFGQPAWCEVTNYGYRNTHVCAIAPTRTNSVITRANSAGIEPITSNVYVAKEAKGNFIRKNPLLEALLELKGKNNSEVWSQIEQDNGSVLSLDFLTFDEKQVFFTAREISQMELIRQACERQPYVDQAQSLNRFVHPDTPIDELNRQIFAGWNNGLKTFYYTKSSSTSSLKNTAMIVTKEGCPYCDKAKALLDSLGVSYIEHKRENIKNFCFKTVPQIWYQGYYVGGYEQFFKTVQIQKKGVQTQISAEYAECEACQ